MVSTFPQLSLSVSNERTDVLCFRHQSSTASPNARTNISAGWCQPVKFMIWISHYMLLTIVSLVSYVQKTNVHTDRQQKTECSDKENVLNSLVSIQAVNRNRLLWLDILTSFSHTLSCERLANARPPCLW